MNYPRVVLAGTHSGAGKTTLSLGVMLALRKRGLTLQPFKAGPDYIDPTYHTQAAGKISRNLDSWLISGRAILELFERQARKADLSIVEGVMGLYDGLADTEAGSTAQLAKILKAPVIIIVDASSLSRSAAAIVLGYAEFDKEVKIKGAILNNIGSADHYRCVKGSIEKKTGIPVLGYLPKNPDLKLPERHLGLVPAAENRLRGTFYNRLSDLIERHIDIDAILKICEKAPAFKRDDRKSIFAARPGPVKDYATIAVAKDRAFNFYYQDNLDILEHFGARLVEFSPLEDKRLPAGANGVYIGGGFPELFARKLSGNTGLKKEIYRRAEDGLPIYAECGGLMYLVEALMDFGKEEFPMVGVFRGSVNMADRLRALGYVSIETLKDNILSKRGDKNRAHVFHWSYLGGLPKGASFAYKVKKNKDRIFYDGLVRRNVFAGYAHLHFASNIGFAKNFITACREHRRRHG